VSKTKYRPRVTLEQKKLINALTIAGLSQKTIAAQVKLPKGTVHNVQKALGICARNGAPLPVELENKIIQMRRKNGAPTIAAKLGLPLHRVQQVFVERRFRQEPGQITSRYYVSDREKRAIRRKQRAFEKDIAKQFAVSDIWMRRFLRRRK
jgi:hypothetical protein